jgi:hypothetical protein
MGQILHGCARTTEVIRWAIQNTPESLGDPAVHYDVNPKTVAKWKRYSTVNDAPTHGV